MIYVIRIPVSGTPGLIHLMQLSIQSISQEVFHFKQHSAFAHSLSIFNRSARDPQMATGSNRFLLRHPEKAEHNQYWCVSTLWGWKGRRVQSAGCKRIATVVALPPPPLFHYPRVTPEQLQRALVAWALIVVFRGQIIEPMRLTTMDGL